MTSPGNGGSAVDADAEVAGRAVRALGAATERLPAHERDRAIDVLAAHDIDGAESETWYPVKSAVFAIEALVDAIGPTQVHSLGGAVVRRLCSSEGIETAADALAALDGGYRRQHRGEAGGYEFRQIGATDGRMECRTPYPCALDRGVVQGVAGAFTGEFVRLNEVGTCGADAGGRCTYEVTW